MKVPLILLIGFISGLFALWASVYFKVVRPLREENIALQKSIDEKIDKISEIIKNGKIYEIIEKY